MLPRRLYDPRNIQPAPPLTRPVDPAVIVPPDSVAEIAPVMPLTRPRSAAEIAELDRQALQGLMDAPPLRHQRPAEETPQFDTQALQGIQDTPPLRQTPVAAEVITVQPEELRQVSGEQKRRVPIKVAPGMMAARYTVCRQRYVV